MELIEHYGQRLQARDTARCVLLNYRQARPLRLCRLHLAVVRRCLPRVGFLAPKQGGDFAPLRKNQVRMQVCLSSGAGVKCTDTGSGA